MNKYIISSLTGLSLRTSKLRKIYFYLILMIPSLLIVFGLVIYPLIYSFLLSLQRWNLFESGSRHYVGFENYINAMRDTDLIASIWKSLLFVGIILTIGVPTSILLSLLLNIDSKLKYFLRVFILIPWAVPPIVNAIQWRYMFSYHTGVINNFLLSLGLINNSISFFEMPVSAILIISIARIYTILPLSALFFLTGLQLIPKSLYDSAKMDGASIWIRFWKITFPYLSVSLFLVCLTLTLYAMHLVAYILSMTYGGPYGATTVLDYFAYINIFRMYRLGYGASLSYYLAFIVVFFAIIFNYIRRKQEKLF